MLRGYVFVQTRVGMGPQVAAEVGRIEGVVSSDGVTGPYDVIACVEVRTLDDLGKLIATRVHAVDGITRTITCVGTRVS